MDVAEWPSAVYIEALRLLAREEAARAGEDDPTEPKVSNRRDTIRGMMLGAG